MTSTVSPAPRALRGIASALGDPVPLVMRQASSGPVDAERVGAIVAAAAREITGVCAGVQVRAALTRGGAALRVRLPIRYPMPVWQVSTVCRTHVLERMQQMDIPVRRLDIEVSELVVRES